VSENLYLLALLLMAGGKSADRIVSNHPNVVFLWVAPQPPCHYLKDPLYAMSKRVNCPPRFYNAQTFVSAYNAQTCVSAYNAQTWRSAYNAQT